MTSKKPGFDSTLRLAVTKCLEARMPFALWRMPGAKKFDFCAAPADIDLTNPVGDPFAGYANDPWTGFVVSFFNNEEDFPVCIPRYYTANKAIKAAAKMSAPGPEPVIAPTPEATDRMKHMAGVSAISMRYARENKIYDKTVLARVVTRRTAADPLEIALRYWATMPADTMLFMYYTAETGLWMGATPELLLDCADDGHYTTMALAGTRPASPDGSEPAPWDVKNRREQQTVARNVIDIVGHTLGQPSEIATSTRRSGAVEHIQTLITGERGEESLREGTLLPVLTSLSPTPAVAGYPHDAAIQNILFNERFSRYCYGGYVGVVDSAGLHTFVNLRSTFIGEPSPDNGERLYNIFAGGGITYKSKPADEWEETELKASRLVAAIDSCTESSCSTTDE